tara:strand:- start:287 stop:406 length:120 start_codon:yes stop_codon:yes gene_type:complete
MGGAVNGECDKMASFKVAGLTADPTKDLIRKLTLSPDLK